MMGGGRTQVSRPVR